MLFFKCMSEPVILLEQRSFYFYIVKNLCTFTTSDAGYAVLCLYEAVCMNMYCTVMVYICWCQWSRRLWSCLGLFSALKRLREKGLRGLHAGLYHLTRTAAIKSNHTQMKLVGQASRVSITLSQPGREQPLLTLMLKRFKSADLEALTQRGMAADT